MNSCAPASLRRLRSRPRAARPGWRCAMFSRTLRLNSMFSCSTTPSWRRSCVASISGDVHAVDQHAALLGQVQALHQLGQRALAGARAAHDADDFAGAARQVHAVQHRRRIGPVAEGHVVELDAPSTAALRGVAAAALRCGCSGCRPAAPSEMPVCWKSVHSCAMRMMGCATLAGEHVEGDELAHGQLAAPSPAGRPTRGWRR